jgi:hypothetical protein
MAGAEMRIETLAPDEVSNNIPFHKYVLFRKQ